MAPDYKVKHKQSLFWFCWWNVSLSLLLWPPLFRCFTATNAAELKKIHTQKRSLQTQTSIMLLISIFCLFRDVIYIILTEITLFILLTNWKKKNKIRIRFCVHRKTDPNRNIQNIFEIKRNFHYSISLTTMSTAWHLSILEARKKGFSFIFKCTGFQHSFRLNIIEFETFFLPLSTQTKRIIVIPVKTMCGCVCLFVL